MSQSAIAPRLGGSGGRNPVKKRTFLFAEKMRRRVDFPIPAAAAKTMIGSGRRRIAAINAAGLRIPIAVLVDEGSGGERFLWLSTEREAADNLISACDKSPSRVAVCVEEGMISAVHRRVERLHFRSAPGGRANTLYSTEPPAVRDASLVALPYHLWANRAPWLDASMGGRA